MDDLMPVLARIAAALERLAPPPAAPVPLDMEDAFVWHPDRAGGGTLAPVARVSGVPLRILQGIDSVRDILLANTLRFASGLPANNAMLWGARGMGKSSLVKAVHAEACAVHPGSLALIEIFREDVSTLATLLARLRLETRRVLVFCDDLSFEREDADYKALKSVLDGGIEGRPETVLFYATSNRRHLMPRDMIENERATAISPAEATEEKVSLSDRFGLWLGFHSCDQATYFAMVDAYATWFGIGLSGEVLHARANEWAIGRGARCGRVAWQFMQTMACLPGDVLHHRETIQSIRSGPPITKA